MAGLTTDAETLAEQLGRPVEEPDLLMLPKYQAYARLLIDGQPTRPFSMRTLPPPRLPLDPHRAEIIRRVSRKRYARPAAGLVPAGDERSPPLEGRSGIGNTDRH